MLRLTLEGISLNAIVQICRPRTVGKGWRERLDSHHQRTMRGLNGSLRLGGEVIHQRLVKKAGLLVLCTRRAPYRETTQSHQLIANQGRAGGTAEYFACFA